MSFERMREALEATARALVAGDPVAASGAAARAEAACQAARAAGVALGDAELSALRALQQRALEAALSARAKLAGDVDRLARSRRAGDAYRRVP